MSDSYDDYESKMQLAEYAWEKRVGEMVKTKHDKQIEIAQAYERGWNAALVQREWVGLTDEELEEMHNEIKVRLMGTYRIKDIYRSIEAKLKEKNT